MAASRSVSIYGENNIQMTSGILMKKMKVPYFDGTANFIERFSNPNAFHIAE